MGRLAVLAALFLASSRAPATCEEPRFVDLSLMIAPELPCAWPGGWPFFQMNPYLRIGPLSAYNGEILSIDPNTGTQLDVPPHSIAHPKSNLPTAGDAGEMTTEKVPAWQFGGEACVIDCRRLVDAAPPGMSALISKEHVVAWENEHRPLGPGDVVLFHSGYSDKYYQPYPAGRRFVSDPLDGKAPAWPDPDPACMEYLGKRGVLTLGVDSPTMGPIPLLPEPTHIAGLRFGMIWTEGAIGLGQLPPLGAFYCQLSPKHVDGAYSEGRAFGVIGEPLAGWLNAAARDHRAVDLSVSMAEGWPLEWPGVGTGNHRQPYFTIAFKFNPALQRFQHTHVLDSHAGSHLVPPAYSLPPPGFDNNAYSDAVRPWLKEYEAKFGPRGESELTTEKIPLEQTCGWARVVDVRALSGTTDKANWPASPEIGVDLLKEYESKSGDFQAGEIVIFRSEWSDKYFRPGKEGLPCMADPLNGKSEGWPALSAEAARYLGAKGIRCVATDAPTLGGVDPKQALWTYWTLGGQGMVGVEFLTNVGALEKKTYFLFAPIKVRGCHGGPGRAIAFHE